MAYIFTPFLKASGLPYTRFSYNILQGRDITDPLLAKMTKEGTKQGVVAVVYPGATAEEIEEQVAGSVEEYIFTFTDVDKTKSATKSRKTYKSKSICLSRCFFD